MNKAFQTWRKRLRHEYDEHGEGNEEVKERLEREKTNGIKYWGRVRTIPRMQLGMPPKPQKWVPQDP
eukprot:5761181-Pleurochrysis_carterae.AAC.1